MMITQRLVQPAYQSIRLMDILNYIPVTLLLRTGRLFYEARSTTRILHYVLLYMSVLKCAQISYALVRHLVDFKMESLHVVILTALWLFLLGTSTYWGSELFHRGVQDTKVLFRNILFTGKVMSLACSILGTYYVIMRHDASWVLTLFFGSLSIQAITFYTVSCLVV